MSNQLLFSKDARAKMAEGASILAKAVKVTLGPRGRNVVIEQDFGAPLIVNDGVTIAKSINLPDKFQNLGASILIEAATKTNDLVGDGTTTAILLTSKLIEEGLAYPCFCTPEHLEEIRSYQEHKKLRLGYYKKYAKCRDLTMEEIKEHLDNGDKYIIRFRSQGDFENKIILHDAIKGDIEMPENDIDEVIIKNDGLPTYHFAHAIDDHLMHTTHVIRGDEWVSSTNKHIQFFNVLGFKVPKYAHIAPFVKVDESTGNKRKLSKRKDPEAAVSFYHEKGVPVEAVMIYLATVANSNFEAWFDCNKDAKIEDFKFDFKKMGASGGSSYDLPKLFNISKNYLSKLTKDEIYDRVLNYSKEFDTEFYDLLVKYEDYSKSIFNIEREQKKPRKDYATYADAKKQIWYMYDELFDKYFENYDFGKITDKEEIKNIINTYIDEYYDENDDFSVINMAPSFKLSYNGTHYAMTDVNQLLALILPENVDVNDTDVIITFSDIDVDGMVDFVTAFEYSYSEIVSLKQMTDNKWNVRLTEGNYSRL